MDKKRIKRSIWDSKILWAVISLFASVVLWGYVTNAQGDVVEKTYDGVQVVFKGQDTLQSKDGYVLSNISTNTVSVTVKATRREVSNLSSSDLRATVDVTKFNSEGNYNQSVVIEFPMGSDSGSINVISTSPRNVTFRIDKASSKTLELKGLFTGTVAEGYAEQPAQFNPQTVTINGSESDLSKVAYALIKIDRTNVDKTLQFDSAYILVDDQGNELNLKNVVLDTKTVSVTVPITATKEVPLSVNLVDGGGATAQNATIICEPATITIAGDAQTLDGINKISLGAVDLSTFASTFEDNLPIVLDNNIINVTGIAEAKVTVQIIGMETKKFNVTNISTINTPTGRSVAVITQNIEVTLRGTSDVLGKIAANNIRAVADLTSIGSTTGTFQPTTKIYVDGYTGVGAIGEYKIYVKIK